MVSLVQPFPPNPITVISTSKFQHKNSDSTTLTKFPNQRRTLFIVSAVKEDDYHSTLKALNSRKRFPRKSLGQHYMLNSTINEELVSVANVKDKDLVLEIGPGTGSLTKVLIDAGATVLAIEKDPHMADLVKERFADTDRLLVLQEDFTKCHFHSQILSLLEDRNLGGTKTRHAKVVANIPFNISKDVVKQLLPMGDIFTEVVLLLQDETAIRLADSYSRSSEYRPINIFVKFYSVTVFYLCFDSHFNPEYKFQVPRANFFPQPNVDGAVVSFKLKKPSDYPSVSSIKSFFALVNSAFNGKRKMLRNTLQHLRTSSEIEQALTTVGLPGTSRPEELQLDDFVKLHNSLVST